jgi:formylglycine-generating enzyme required for sulfatase activity
MKNKLSLITFSIFLFYSIPSFSQNTKEIQKKHKEFIKNLPGFKFIPSGAFNILEGYDSLVSFRAFYMQEAEVSNFNYLEYLNDIKGEISNDSLNKLWPDTTVWYNSIDYRVNSNWYRWHPAYDNFPAVGLTHLQAKTYCLWLTNKLNQSETSPFKRIVARLPLKSEWEYAASGNNLYSVYPWTGRSLKDNNGEYKANFKSIDQANIKSTSNDTLFSIIQGKCIYGCSPDQLISKCKSFESNKYGLYNMAGNVSEFVQEEHVLKGGSFNSTGYYLNLYHSEEYQEKEYRSAETGFRIVIQIVEY